MTSWARRAIVAALLATAMSSAPPAFAHALLARSSPGDGTQISGSPSDVKLWFTENVVPGSVSVQVVDARGVPVAGTRAHADGSVVTATLPKLHRGTYGILWRVVAADDGHATEGAVAFGVGTAAGGATSRAADPTSSFSTLEALFRWLEFSAFAGVFGSVLVAGLVLGRGGIARARASVVARRRLLIAAAACALAGAVADVGRLVYQVVQVSNSPAVLGTRWGVLWAVCEAAFLATGLLCAASLRRPVATLWPATALLVILATAHAMASHAAALGASEPQAVAADAVHVLAAGAWMGSVAALTVALWPARGIHRMDSLALARAGRRRFAVLAASSMCVVLASGLYSAGLEVMSVDGLLTTQYGRLLLLKTSLVLAAGALGAANFLLLRRLDAGTRGGRVLRVAASRRVLAPEVGAGLAVLLAAAVLASSAPARGPQFRAPQPAVATSRSGEMRDLVVSMTGSPGRIGTNAFTALVASWLKPAPAPIDSVALEIGQAGGGPTRTVELRRVDADRYFGTADLRTPGRMRITVVVRRGGERITLPFTWPVRAADPARPVTYSARPLGPIVDAAAAALVASAGLAGAWLLFRRRRPALGGAVPLRPRSER
jgi:copper transport protein